MGGPLAGIRVIEASQVISGPLCGMLLAQQGAEVIKVESPGGDPTRLSGNRRAGIGVMYANCNRGKRVICLDATKAEGLDLLQRLIDSADVFTQNFRPGKATKMGIGPDVMLARNPGLVYASISGYGPDGPYSGHKVYDYVIQATVGFADAQRDATTGKPTLVRNYVVDKATGYAAAQAVTAALLARERDPERRGQHLDLAMLDVGLEFFWPEGMMEHTYLEVEGTEFVPANLNFYDTYSTLDGAIAVYPIVPSFFGGLCRACGHPEWTEDPRFSEVFERRRNMAAFAELVAAAIATFSTVDAIQRLERHDVAVADVVELANVPEHPQVRWNESLVERVDPVVGRVRVPRHAPQFGRTPVDPPGDVPALGQHTDQVLSEMGLPASEIARLRAAGVVS